LPHLAVHPAHKIHASVVPLLVTRRAHSRRLSLGTSRLIVATQHFGRERSEAHMDSSAYRPDK
jgi:hypothetical protein